MTVKQKYPQTTNPFLKNGDYIVFIGEFNQFGYLSEVFELSKRLGLHVIGSTVGRRDENGILRRLTEEEKKSFPFPIINIPLEAGFDLEPGSEGYRIVDYLEQIDTIPWEQIEMSWNQIGESRERALQRLNSNYLSFLNEANNIIPEGRNILFLHSMAGGVPRNPKIYPLISRLTRGLNDQFLSIPKFFETSLGQMIEMNFLDVTASSYAQLIDCSLDFQKKRSATGGQVAFGSYGYHGCELSTRFGQTWKCAMTYTHANAKLELERISENRSRYDHKTTVFNCPEIVTQAASMFPEVELLAYPFLDTLIQSESKNGDTVLRLCRSFVKDSNDLEKILDHCYAYLFDVEISNKLRYELWPIGNSPAQMEKMMRSVRAILGLHPDPVKHSRKIVSKALAMAVSQVILKSDFQEPCVNIGHGIAAHSLVRYEDFDLEKRFAI